jgi:hypothetical protein
MIIFDFITQDEIDDLPDDDPQAAFVSFVRIAQRRLGERTAKIDARDQWEELNEARHGFMNVVIAAGKKYEIEPFASLSVPRLNKFDSENTSSVQNGPRPLSYTTAARQQLSRQTRFSPHLT